MPNFVPIETEPATEAERDKGDAFVRKATCRQCRACVRKAQAKPFLNRERRGLMIELKELCPRDNHCSPAEEVVPPGVSLWVDFMFRWIEMKFDGKDVFGVTGELAKTVPVAVCAAGDRLGDRNEVAFKLRRAGFKVRECGAEPSTEPPVLPSTKPKPKPRKKKKAGAK